jgi:hypothetical protein
MGDITVNFESWGKGPTLHIPFAQLDSTIAAEKAVLGSD